jgi:hypothetical protein
VLERRQPELFAERRRVQDEIDRLFVRLRAGPGASQAAAELDELRSARAALDRAYADALGALLAEARVLLATLSKLAVFEPLWAWPAEAILVDETSMAPFPGVLAAALRARRRLLLFGDFRQLPPIALADTPEAADWLGRDAFQIAGVRQRVDAGEPEPRVTLLETQYRMAPAIGTMVSELAYGGRLRSAPGLAEIRAPLALRRPCAGEALVLVDTGPLASVCSREPRAGSFSRLNPVHALLASGLVREALRHGWRSIGVVTPYRAQARLVERMLRSWEAAREATAATVHRFQGAERDLLVFDLVDAPPQAGASRLTGRDPDTALRLLNVAVSRARGKLIVLADAAFVRGLHPPDSPARRLLELVEAKGSVLVRDAAQWNAELDLAGSLWAPDWAAVQEALEAELALASRSLVLHLPDDLLPSESLLHAVGRFAGSGARTLVFAPFEAARRLEATKAELGLLGSASGFFALLDARVAYVGAASRSGAFTRVAEPAVVELLGELLVGPLERRPGEQPWRS